MIDVGRVYHIQCTYILYMRVYYIHRCPVTRDYVNLKTLLSYKYNIHDRQRESVEERQRETEKRRRKKVTETKTGTESERDIYRERDKKETEKERMEYNNQKITKIYLNMFEEKNR